MEIAKLVIAIFFIQYPFVKKICAYKYRLNQMLTDCLCG